MIKELDDEFKSNEDILFKADKRRQGKIDFKIKPYFRKCTKFFSRYDTKVSRPEDYLLMSRSFRHYQEGEKFTLNPMTMKQVKDYLILKGKMLEQPEKPTKEKRECKDYVKLSQKEWKQY